MTPERPLRISVKVDARVDPYQLRAAIAARLAGRPFPLRAEDAVAAQVADAVRGQARAERR